MQVRRLFVAILTIVPVDAALAADCTDRIVEIPAPAMPTSLRVQHTLIREGACTLVARFDIISTGEAKKIEVDSQEERCQGLVRSVKQALEVATFSKGDRSENCERQFKFQLSGSDKNLP